MRTKILGAIFAFALMAGGGSPLLAGTAEASPADKVNICHSTRSEKNPVVYITVSGNAAAAHAAHHDGDDILSEECQ